MKTLPICAFLIALGPLAGAEPPAGGRPARVPPDVHHESLTPSIETPLILPPRSVPKGNSASPPADNFIDKAIFSKIADQKIPRASVCSDQEFVRRISLDLTGRLPEPDELRAFLADADQEKRSKLIDKILATSTKGVTKKPSTPFLDRWSYFFADLFRVSNLMGPGRVLFHQHLRNFLTVNQPYDEFVRDLLTTTARSNYNSAAVNFLVRFYVDQPNQSTVNPEDTYDELAIRTTRMFLGINLECASCHDGRGHLEKVNLWLTERKRSDLWKQAAFFGKVRLYRPYGDLVDEFVLSNEGKGYDTASKSVIRPPRYKKDVSPAFLLTGEQPSAGEDPRQAYARFITGHIQFARATVNMVWAELFGSGLVDPPFDFDLTRYGKNSNLLSGSWAPQTQHAVLLDALAKDFQEHQFDLRYLIRTLVNTSAYQLSSQLDGPESNWKPEYKSYFARRMVRRLPAEQMWDAVSQATGVFDEFSIGTSGTKVTYVLQTASPDDLSPKVRGLLGSFGLDDRVLAARTTNPSMVQASILLNNEIVKNKVTVAANGRLAKLLHREPPLSNAAIVEELFLAALSRTPSSAESQAGVKLISEQHERGAEDLMWVLLNQPEFLLNY